MEPVTIQLNESPLFFIPGVIHLTVDNPGPVEFDPTKLTPQQKQWINNAHFQRKVTVINPNGPVETKETLAPKAPEAKDQNALMHSDRDSELEKVKELLEIPLAALRKDLAKSSDIKLLRLVKKIEEDKNKPRKSLVLTIDTRLKELSEQVAARIGGSDVGNKLNPVNVRGEDPNIVELLEDVEERTITIRPAVDSDFEGDGLLVNE